MLKFMSDRVLNGQIATQEVKLEKASDENTKKNIELYLKKLLEEKQNRSKK